MIALGVLVPAGTYAYIHWIEDDAPERLSLDSGAGEGETLSPSTSAEAVADDGGLDGTWRPTDGSLVGYRVKEILFGQDKDAVGRTDDVTGTLTVNGTSVTAVKLTVDMTTVESDQSRRDGQFHGRIMDTASFPTATFELSEPIEVPSLPDESTTVTARATGELTLRGRTRTVTFDLEAQRRAGHIDVNGAIPIVFEEWGIPNPSFGPVTTEDRGELEFLVVFEKSV